MPNNIHNYLKLEQNFAIMVAIICSIGDTRSDGRDAALIAKFPQCVNGFILASAEGYEQAKYQISTTVTSPENVYQGSKSCSYIELHFEQ